MEERPNQPRPTSVSSINALPPPRFSPGTSITIKETLQKDPVLKLIPTKRPRPVEKFRRYRLHDPPVTEDWENEFDLWVQQEIELLSQEDSNLAAGEMGMVFGERMAQEAKEARQLLNKRGDRDDFAKAKVIVAKMLNRNRALRVPRVSLIPTIPLHTSPAPMSPTRSDPPPEVPSTTQHRAHFEPQDVKPVIRGINSAEAREEEEGGGGGGRSRTRTHDHSLPTYSEPDPTRSASTSEPTSTASTPPPLSLSPNPKVYTLHGMREPFPPFFVEIYLDSRRIHRDAAKLLDMMKGLFSGWVKSVGVAVAERYIAELHRMSINEDDLGGPKDEERSRRNNCSRYFLEFRKSQVLQANSSQSSSRRTSPVIPASQLPPLPDEAPPSRPSSPKKICNKCVAESLPCDGEDPCRECVARGRYHLCTFPEPQLSPPPPPSTRSPPRSAPPPLPKESSPVTSSSEPPQPTPPLDFASEHTRMHSFPQRTTEDSSQRRTSLEKAPTTATRPLAPPTTVAPPDRTITFPPPSRESISLDQARQWARVASLRSTQEASHSRMTIPSSNPTPPTFPPSSFGSLNPSQGRSQPPTVSQLLFDFQQQPLARQTAPQQIPQHQTMSPAHSPLLGSNPSPQASPNLQGVAGWTPYVLSNPSNSAQPRPQPTPPLPRHRPNSTELVPLRQRQLSDSAPRPQQQYHAQQQQQPSSQYQQQPQQQRPPQAQPPPVQVTITRFKAPSWQNFVRGLPPHLENIRSALSKMRPPTPNSSTLQRSASRDGK